MQWKHYAMFAGGVFLSIVAIRVILGFLPASVSGSLPAVAQAP